MSAVVRFLPELGRWLLEGLAEGRPPAVLLKTMIDERMEPVVAQAIVDAFVAARRAGRPVPLDAVTIDDDVPVFVRERSLLPPGPRLAFDGRSFPVLARGDAPNLALIAEVLTAAECRQLIELARPRLRPSQVVDPHTGEDVVAKYRDSVGMFFRLEETPFIAELDRRLSGLMSLPLENGEGLQVLCYRSGGSTAAHFDYLLPSNPANQASVARSGQRVSTLLIYLNDVEAGGETVFPDAGLRITPQRGNGLYFESSNSRGQLDRQSFHAGNPVLAGEKWVVTKWMRQRRFVAG
jgi:prolyl 4-hydroxylase